MNLDLMPQDRIHRSAAADQVSANLVPLVDFRQFARDMVRHPVFVVLVLLPLLLTVTGALRHEFVSMPANIAIGLYCLRVTIYVLMVIYFFPKLARMLLSRNVPFFYCYLCFFVLASIFGAVMSAIIIADDSLMEQLTRFARQLAFSTIVNVIFVLAIEHLVRAKLGVDPALVPVWRPHRIAPDVAITPAAPIIDNGVISLNAQNQYVAVRMAGGTKLLRMTMKDAVAQLPAQSGLQVHRSWWIANHLPVGLKREGRNYLVVGPDGETYPVSREKVADVRAILRNPSAANQPVKRITPQANAVR